MFFRSKPMDIPSADRALPGRQDPIPTAPTHYVNGHPLKGPFPEGIQTAVFGMGCFWGVERKFWQLNKVDAFSDGKPGSTFPENAMGLGIYVTAVGYIGGPTPNPTYEEVCSGLTGHNEVVLVAYDPKVISYQALLKVFWEGHDPTQGMRQGNDRGTQYRSGIYYATQAERDAALASKAMFQDALHEAGLGMITTEIMAAPQFYYAEGYHQQYLAKNPAGYCGIGGTGVSCPIGTGASS